MKIEISKTDLARVDSLLADIKNGSTKALVTAINATLTNVQTKAAQNVGADLALTAKRIKEDFSLAKANYTNVSGAFISKGEPIGLMQYAAKPTKKGVSFKVKRAGSRTTVAHAFIAPGKGGKGQHVWWRGKIWKRPVNPKMKYGALPRKYRFPESSNKNERGIQRRTGPRIEDILGETTSWNWLNEYAGIRIAFNLATKVEDILRRHRG